MENLTEKPTTTNANDQFTQHTGSGHFYKTNFGHLVTEGAHDLCTACESFWLMDIILSYQISRKVAAESFQVWELKRVKGDRFNVTATDGNDNILLTQKIPFSDFPYDTATLWNVNKTIMLPSEY